MFTGLIRHRGEVKSFSGGRLTIRTDYQGGMGDSIAVNGACLTVVACHDDGFSVELSDESTTLLATENYHGSVHIEPAMRLSDRLEGHIVQGHVDGIGTISRMVSGRRGTDYFIDVPSSLIPLIAPKGSITIDGVSLTVNDVFEDSFRLTIIPHTLQETLLGTYQIGRRVNIETDLFARYIAHMMGIKNSKLDWETAQRFCAMY